MCPALCSLHALSHFVPNIMLESYYSHLRGGESEALAGLGSLITVKFLSVSGIGCLPWGLILPSMVGGGVGIGQVGERSRGEGFLA